jgi:hypothetical protein
MEHSFKMKKDMYALHFLRLFIENERKKPNSQNNLLFKHYRRLFKYISASIFTVEAIQQFHQLNP